MSISPTRAANSFQIYYDVPLANNIMHDCLLEQNAPYIKPDVRFVLNRSDRLTSVFWRSGSTFSTTGIRSNAFTKLLLRGISPLLPLALRTRPYISVYHKYTDVYHNLRPTRHAPLFGHAPPLEIKRKKGRALLFAPCSSQQLKFLAFSEP